jgi:hypothetical protein
MTSNSSSTSLALPKEIICVILLYLPTSDVVRTRTVCHWIKEIVETTRFDPDRWDSIQRESKEIFHQLSTIFEDTPEVLSTPTWRQLHAVFKYAIWPKRWRLRKILKRASVLMGVEKEHSKRRFQIFWGKCRRVVFSQDWPVIALQMAVTFIASGIQHVVRNVAMGLPVTHLENISVRKTYLTFPPNTVFDYALLVKGWLPRTTILLVLLGFVPLCKQFTSIVAACMAEGNNTTYRQLAMGTVQRFRYKFFGTLSN